MIAVEQLRELLDYDPETGVLRWKVSRGGWGAGRIAGRIDVDGGRRIGIAGRLYPAHQLAWLYVTGEWPAQRLDHRNADRADNRIKNLRLATQSQNLANARVSRKNTSGFKGVSRSGNRWVAFLKVNGKNRNLGSFKTPEEAHAAYAKASREAFGEFARVA